VELGAAPGSGRPGEAYLRPRLRIDRPQIVIDLGRWTPGPEARRISEPRAPQEAERPGLEGSSLPPHREDPTARGPGMVGSSRVRVWRCCRLLDRHGQRARQAWWRSYRTHVVRPRALSLGLATL
jgi:hypothetical protein